MFVASSTPSTTRNTPDDPLEVRADAAQPLGEPRATTRARARRRGTARRCPARTRTSRIVPRPTSPRPRRDRERGREQRADARAPARAERDADDVGPRDAGDLRAAVGISRRSRDSGPRAMPSSASPITMITTPPTTRTPSWNVVERRAEQSRDRAQAREHRREAGDEDQRGRNRARGIVRVAHLADDDPEVRGDERDDARREERRDTRAEQRDDLGEHRRT